MRGMPYAYMHAACPQNGASQILTEEWKGGEERREDLGRFPDRGYRFAGKLEKSQVVRSADLGEHGATQPRQAGQQLARLSLFLSSLWMF